MSEDELKLTRRLFLEHTAMATAMSGAVYSIALKTDAQAQADDGLPMTAALSDEDILPYVYFEGPK